jgi:hypothetical protein
VRRGIALRALGELREAATLLTAAGDEASALGRMDLRGAALVALANIDTKQGRGADAKRRLTEAAPLAEAAGDLTLRVRAVFEMAAVRGHFEGASDRAIIELRGALKTAGEIEDRALLVEGHLRIGTLLVRIGESPRRGSRHVAAGTGEVLPRRA